MRDSVMTTRFFGRRQSYLFTYDFTGYLAYAFCFWAEILCFLMLVKHGQ